MALEDQKAPTEEAPTAPQFTGEAAPPAAEDEVSAWEQVGAGRFMPRRIKGSCKGRALG